jgi:hypothetical protein
MQKLWTQRGMLISTALASSCVFAWLLVAGAASAEIYAWRTEDGVYAYTDDPDHVPPRYAAEAKVMDSTSLNGYERYTRTDPAASQRYTDRLEKRLRYLRAANEAPAPVVATPRSSGVRSVSIATGNAQAPTVDIDASGGGAPIVVEPLHMLDPGAAITRPTTLVKQGGRTIAVLKGRQRETSLDDDIVGARELESGY